MKKLLLFSILILFVGLSLNYFKSNAQDADLVPVPCGNPNSPPCPEPTPQVVSVIFEQINSPIDGNPNMGNGRRIFPDKESPTDAMNRKIVKVTATLSSTTGQANVKVTFKTFDVDDPSTSLVIDPNGDSGDDNNGSPKRGTLSNNINDVGTSDTITVGPDENGVSVAYLTVTMQPGDNFAVAASIDATYLNNVSVEGTGLKHITDGTLPTAKAKRTEMLTVWRRLHIEVDSMGAVTGNKVEGTLTETKKIGIGNQTINLSVNDLEVNRFENGNLVILHGTPASVFKTLRVRASNYNLEEPPPFPVIDYANTSNSVTILNNTNVFSISPNDSFILYDDDDINNDGVTDGDENDDVPEPDLGILTSDDVRCDNTFNTNNCNMFLPAYIRPMKDLSGNGETITYINANAAKITNIRETFFQNRPYEASIDFWTIYLLGAYQYRTDLDSDSDFEDAIAGITDGIAPNDGEGSVVFAELTRAAEYNILDIFNPSIPSWRFRPVDNRFTTAHELGHLFGATHRDFTERTTNAGLMAEGFRRVTPSFTEVTINKIRGGTGLYHP
jgi:hypothetical protein